jgi:hypothetical protein
VQTARQMVLELLGMRFSVPDDVRGRVNACTDTAMLNAWFRRAVNAASLDEVFTDLQLVMPAAGTGRVRSRLRALVAISRGAPELSQLGIDAMLIASPQHRRFLRWRSRNELVLDGQSAMPRAARSPSSTRRIICAVTAPMSARTSSS